jgi:hypothetical protein
VPQYPDAAEATSEMEGKARGTLGELTGGFRREGDDCGRSGILHGSSTGIIIYL